MSDTRHVSAAMTRSERRGPCESVAELLEDSREKLIRLLETCEIGMASRAAVTPLSPDKAIGARADPNLAIRKGKERVIEARLGQAIGQSFTDRPSVWGGTLNDWLSLDLSNVRSRAVFVAVMNAVLRSLGMVSGTIHCRDSEPSRCGPVLAERVESLHQRKRVGLIGLQPTILGGLVDRLGAEVVRVVDLNPDNIGQSRCGVEVWDGGTDLPRLVDWCEVGLATGSSIVNGTINDIRRRFQDAGKPLLFFGNTIAGAAVLLDLDRVCPFAT